MLSVGQMLGKGHEGKHKVEQMRTMLASSQMMYLHPGATLRAKHHPFLSWCEMAMPLLTSMFALFPIAFEDSYFLDCS